MGRDGDDCHDGEDGYDGAEPDDGDVEMVVMVVMAVMVVGRTVSHVVLIVLVNFSRLLWLEKHIRTRSNFGFRATAPVQKAEPDAYSAYQSYSSLWPS